MSGSSDGKPVFLDVPLPEPEPVNGCAGCAGWAAARITARKAHDYTAVSDANVRLRRHLALRHG
ncbi:hypothetical protein TG1_48 [Streptomyces phage TG1]|uniref:Uncharacterized protein n=1 Tax=Streptomyces phage TG1 TaxID=2927987 RepID=K4HZ66_9CAUD|nr:hypothetical protein D281_gp49 [Streptomyces phage TG1]AFU62243.1 hypothetical protein TG1_48 [Streptomyces phage TG1]